ncbi:hypothetical protein WMY93_016782 [Mugilogobius chulae]|uniref:KASH domain-containing protein n=1 Tax=Mugilogobius chulae TaxID=88201 RepID=A0AAW0NR51_9GOBI
MGESRSGGVRGRVGVLSADRTGAAIHSSTVMSVAEGSGLRYREGSVEAAETLNYGGSAGGAFIQFGRGSTKDSLHTAGFYDSTAQTGMVETMRTFEDIQQTYGGDDEESSRRRDQWWSTCSEFENWLSEAEVKLEEIHTFMYSDDSLTLEKLNIIRSKKHELDSPESYEMYNHLRNNVDENEELQREKMESLRYRYTLLKTKLKHGDPDRRPIKGLGFPVSRSKISCWGKFKRGLRKIYHGIFGYEDIKNSKVIPRRNKKPGLLYRVCCLALPLWLLLLALLLLAFLLPLTEESNSCSLSNNFARSFNIMLRYQGPPPT